ncbi:DEKNAAC103192 [Brettanomyces naardenensis]|uniref:DEKNAAC103192 n=1 Tax=Brettanomyces naardenensis TaxID=13370 RepID=A0A448YMN2_BRENA|nr:DEKNAAC103192 [Brettanomyces naardenensis]
MELLYQLLNRPPYPTESYHDKTVVVTGSNTGLGKEAARHFARLGVSKLILGVRNLEKGEAAKKDIVKSTQCGADVVEVWKLDMASYQSVKDFAKKVNSLPRVDIFLGNAGLARAKFVIVEQDETDITVNVVSTLLLSLLVLPVLKKTAREFGVHPTLTITSSGTHGWTTLPAKSAPEGQIFTTISDERFALAHWNEQYPVSKLLELFAVRAIAEHFPDLPVTVNCVNPGLCQSELSREMDSWTFEVFKSLFGRSTEVGGRTLVYAGSQGPETYGKYVSNCRITEPSKFVRSAEGEAVQERVWVELVDKLERIQKGVTDVLKAGN